MAAGFLIAADEWRMPAKRIVRMSRRGPLGIVCIFCRAGDTSDTEGAPDDTAARRIACYGASMQNTDTVADLTRRLAEADRMNALLRETIAHMANGFAICEPDGRYLLKNTAMVALNDLPPGFVPETHWEAITWQWQAGHAVGDRGATLEEHLAKRRRRFDAADGAPMISMRPSGRWIETRIWPLAEGRRLIVHDDVTVLKEREAELQAAHAAAEKVRETMQTVLDNVTDGLGLLDSEGRNLLANEAIIRLNGWPRHLLTGDRPLLDLLRWQFENAHTRPAEGEDVEAFVARVFAEFRAGDGHPVVNRRPNGVWIERRFVRLSGERILIMHRDITALKEREAELQAAHAAANEVRETLQTVLDHSPDALMLFDADGTWRYASAALFHIQEADPDVLAANRNFRELVAWQASQGQFGPAEVAAEYVKASIARFEAADGETRLRRRRDGRWFGISFHRIPGNRTLGLYRDVTKLKSQEEQLARERDAAEAASRAKSSFLATMSHEIRTPMNGVVGMLDVLEHEGLTPAQRGIVETMRASAAALLRIVDDVLDFSKIEAGRLDLEETAFDLCPLVVATAEALRPQLEAKGLALEVEVPKNVWLRGDPTRVGQVLFNLLGNAAKFTEAGQVAVHATAAPLPDGRVRVTLAVADTGIGLDDLARERLFEPFTQADSSTTRRFGGTGLGLSIVQRLAALMEGDVAVDSVPGEGTTFTVTLILRAAPPAASAPTMPASPATSNASVRGQRVLVVDDHPVNRAVLVRQLELLGIEAHAVEDGHAALGRLRAGGYAALMADIHMPGMDGYALAAALRAMEGPNTLRLPIIAVTANAMKGEAERCIAAGMDGYLTKPVTIARLREVLVAWLPVCAAADAVPEPLLQQDGALDRSVLEAWFGEDRLAMADLLDRFVETAEAAAPALREAVSHADWARLRNEAHRLKGVARAVGANPLAEVADVLERASAENEAAQGLRALAVVLPAALEAARDVVISYRHGR